MRARDYVWEELGGFGLARSTEIGSEFAQGYPSGGLPRSPWTDDPGRVL